MADVSVGVQQLRQPGGDRVNLDAGDQRAGVHVVGHEADEVAEAQGRLQDATVREPEPLQRRVHGPDDDRRGVMGVEGGGAGGVQFLWAEELLQPLPFSLPLVVPGIEDLGQPAPADVTDQHALLVVRRCAALGLNPLQQFDGSEVVLAIALEGAVAEPVGVGDAVIARVAGRFRFGDRRPEGNPFFVTGQSVSGGRRR